MGSIVVGNKGIALGLGWTAVVILGEFLIYLLYKRFFTSGMPAPRRARLVYVAACFALCLVWTSVPWVFWHGAHAGLSAAAVIILSAQMIHTQAFAYRSMPTLLVTGLPPALAMLAMPWVAGPLVGIERVTFTLIALVAIGYGWASINAHRGAARMLREANDELERMAYFDVLTSLSNRRQFSDHMRRLIALSQRRGTRFALLLLDLDQFKSINDRLGHDAGDTVLMEIGARLQSAVRSEDDVARIGGDEFAVLLADADDEAAIAVVCDRIANSCHKAIEVNGTVVHSTLSVGVALFPDNGDQQESLYKSADIALYQAKRSGRNAWRYSKANAEQIALRSRSGNSPGGETVAL